MKDNIGLPIFQPAPQTYNQAYLNDQFVKLSLFLRELTSVGPVRTSAINISDLPTSATGLRTGDLWNDSGTVKIV